MEDVLRLLSGHEGHFALESGHHGELWLDLERLFLHPERVQPLAAALAERLGSLRVEAVCAPLIEGAFVGLLVASRLGVPFSYAEPKRKSGDPGLFPVAYRVPDALRAELRDRRVAVVNDVVNAGSAVLGTLDDLGDCGAEPTAIATLAVLGSGAEQIARARGLRLETLAALPNRIWKPSECPLCIRGIPLGTAAKPASL